MDDWREAMALRYAREPDRFRFLVDRVKSLSHSHNGYEGRTDDAVCRWCDGPLNQDARLVALGASDRDCIVELMKAGQHD